MLEVVGFGFFGSGVTWRIMRLSKHGYVEVPELGL